MATKAQDLNIEELESLRDRAQLMNIKIPKGATLDEIRELVNNSLTKTPTPQQQQQTLANECYKEAMKLVRIRLVCMNPNKKSLSAEYVAAGNSFTPFVIRTVPYNVETHVENIIYECLKNREISYIVYEKNKDGVEYPIRKMRKEFQVEVLPPLTKEELDKLRIDQSKRIHSD